MKRWILGILPMLLWLIPLFGLATPDELGTPRVCVATVSNASTVSAYVERLTERLVKSLKRDKVESLAMESSTTMQRKLKPTRLNLDEADDKQCEYTLLTQIVEVRTHPGVPQTTEPRPGAIVPSIDAADPLGGSSGPVYREEEQISFALFRSQHDDPVVDTYVRDRASANVSDSFLAGMDRIANRVSHELKK